MDILNDMPIRRKIRLVILLATGGALIVAGMAGYFIESLYIRPFFVRRLPLLAEFTATHRWAVYLVVIGAGLVIALFIGVLFSYRLQRAISDPIIALARMADMVARRHDYSIRIEDRRKDEIGLLARAFNGMLEEIEAKGKALQESELRHRNLFAFNPMPIMVFEPDTLRILSVNRALCALYGYEEEQLSGMTAPQLLPLSEIHRVNGDQNGHPEPSTFSGPVAHETKNGSIIQVEQIVQDVVWDGRPARLVLINDITEQEKNRKELEELNRQLITASRQGGMAEVATGVLHNVGNALNSINVSATLINEQIRRSRIQNLEKVVQLLMDHTNDMGDFMTSSPQGVVIPGYLQTLTRHLISSQNRILTESELLVKNIGLVKEIIIMQQNYAKASDVLELGDVDELIEDTLRLHREEFASAGIRVEIQGDNIPPVLIDRYKVIQILVNLLKNAIQALEEKKGGDRWIQIWKKLVEEKRLLISVGDNGIGIPAENLQKIFSFGFTTKPHGRGFGLHHSALSAREMEGSLSVVSGGIGLGALFMLDIPVEKSRKDSP